MNKVKTIEPISINKVKFNLFYDDNTNWFVIKEICELLDIKSDDAKKILKDEIIEKYENIFLISESSIRLIFNKCGCKNFKKLKKQFFTIITSKIPKEVAEIVPETIKREVDTKVIEVEKVAEIVPDVCKALGIKNASRAIKKIDEVDKIKLQFKSKSKKINMISKIGMDFLISK